MGKIGRANCLADLGYQRAEYLVQPTNEHCLGEGFGPAAAGQKCRTEATIDLLQRLLEIPGSAYGKL